MRERFGSGQQGRDILPRIFCVPLAAILALRVLWSGVAYPESNTVILLFLSVLSAIYLLLSSFLKDTSLRWSGLDSCFLFYFVIMLFIYLFSGRRWLARDFLIQMFACTMVYFLARDMGRLRYGRTTVLVGLVAVTFLVSIYGLYQQFWGFSETRSLFFGGGSGIDKGAPFLSRLYSRGIFSTFFFPNALAGYLIVIVPILALFLFSDKRERFIVAFWSYLFSILAVAVAWGFYADLYRRFFLLGYLILAAAVLITGLLVSAKRGSSFWLSVFSMPLFILPVWALALTASEASWFALFLAVVIFCPLLVGRLRLTVVVTVALLVLATIAFIGGWIPESLGNSMDVRLDYWAAAMKAWCQRPLLGMGQGTFPYAYMLFRAPASEEGRMAHSIYLNLAAETGIVGLAAFVFLWIAFLLSVGPSARRGNWLCFAGFLSVCAFLVHGVVGVGLTVPAITLTVWALAGVCVGAGQSDARGPQLPRLLYLSMGLLMLAAILFWVLPHARAVRYRMEAIRLAGQGRLDRSCMTVNRAIAIEPANPAYWTTLADALKIRGQDQQALEAYKRAAILGEDLAPYHFRLAAHSWRVSTDASNPALAASAIGELRKAIRCNPHDIDYHLLLGYWLETTGEKREALKEYRDGLELISAALERPEKIRRHSPAEYERLNLLVRERIAEL